MLRSAVAKLNPMELFEVQELDSDIKAFFEILDKTCH